MTDIEVTVVIPTLCGTERSEQLLRAIASIKAQIDVSVAILVVINGNRFDHNLLTKVKNYGVGILILEKAGISSARLLGRQNITSPYFMFLDDDDELYPYSTKELLQSFNSSNSDIGIVIADAYSCQRQRNFGFVSTPEEIESNPLKALLKENWLIIQSALFKTESVPAFLFDIETTSNECTLLAFRLANHNIKVKVNTKPLAIIHDSPNSESKSEHFITKEPDVIKTIIKMDLPKDITSELKQKLSKSFHNNSTYYLNRGLIFKAIHAHINSLILPGGFKYLLYTRHLLTAIFKKKYKK
jgi:glycosyltransferase involved in cell wall biosynthesis